MSTTMGTELWRLGAGELAAAIRERRVSSREVVEAHLFRIEERNGDLNAVTAVLAEQARAGADEADRQIAAGGATGALHGVPFTIKENVDVAGTPTTWGIPALAGATADQDAPQVANLRAAGAIPLARTNLPDFALRWHSDNQLHGAVRNPWDASRTPGGSSGGEAAALAAGMTPLGVGNDLGGSVRWPAQCCGICSLKPTLGRVPQATVVEPVDSPISIQLMAVQGPMARHVEDLRIAAEAMIAPSPRDPWHVPMPLAGPSVATPVRVAVVTDPGGLGTSPQVAAGVRRAAEALAAAGYAIEEVDPPDVNGCAAAWATMVIADLRIMWQLMGQLGSPDANRFMNALLDSQPVADAVGVMQAYQARQALGRAWELFQVERPLVLAPICTEPPFAVGADLQPEGVATILQAMRMVVTVNLLGVPAVAVPTGVGDGLPQVVQVIGPRFREDLCLDAAQAIQDACGIVTPI